MSDGLINADARPVLERLHQVSTAGHRVIIDNIANLETPDFQPRDLSVESFQSQLGEAIDERRREAGAGGGPLNIADTRQLTFHEGRLEAHPVPSHENILFHDRNDRDLEPSRSSWPRFCRKAPAMLRTSVSARKPPLRRATSR